MTDSESSSGYVREDNVPGKAVSKAPAIKAAIFDMDGLLTESESRWRQAELEISKSLGLDLSISQLEDTMGIRMFEVAEIWHRIQPWDGPSPAQVAQTVVDRVIELGESAVCLPGVQQSLQLVHDAGLRVALCSSSDKRLVDATLTQLNLSDSFEVVHSAENDEHGKPHPMPYLVTAELLGVDPRQCLVFEDSLNGCISGRAAFMRVVAVPDIETSDRQHFSFCDAVLGSLEELTAERLSTLCR